MYQLGFIQTISDKFVNRFSEETKEPILIGNVHAIRIYTCVVIYEILGGWWGQQRFGDTLTRLCIIWTAPEMK